MRKKFCIFLLALCLLLTACAPAAQSEMDPVPEPDLAPAEEVSAPEEIPVSEEASEPELSQRDQDWIEDIEFLREEYTTRHPDPFYFCTEEEFDRKMDQLTARVGELSDSDIFYELASIIAGMGDNHTRVWWDGDLPYCDRMFPVNMFPLNGRLYLWSYMEGYEQFEPYLLHEIVGVNGVDSMYLLRRAASLYESDWLATTGFPHYPSFFDWVGCDHTEGYTLQVLDGNQEVVSLELPVVTLAQRKQESGSMIIHEGLASLAFVKGIDQTAYYEGEDGGCIQWCIGPMWYTSNLWYQLKEVEKLMEAHPDCNKVAVDLRECPGGSTESLSFLEEVRMKAELLEGKQIYVLTWGYTCSAATRMIAFFQDEFSAVTVGEPTGQFYSFFSRSDRRAASPSVLPNSQIKVYISDLWRSGPELLEEMGVTPGFEVYYDENGKLYEWEVCIQPDVFVHLDIEDIRQGKDSVIEWVLAQ